MFYNNAVCGNLANNSYWFWCDSFSPAAVTDGCTGLGFKNGFWGGSNGLQAYVTIQAGQTYILHTVCRNFPSNAPSRATLSFQGQVVLDHPDLFNYPGCAMATQDFIKDNTSIYPNPFTTSLHIQSDRVFKTMALYDVLGKQLFKKDFVNDFTTSNLARGLYLLRLVTEEGVVISKKVVKE